jgi:hypothetical protein
MLGSVIAATSAESFRAGVARVDITPPPGTPMAGYYHERGADGVLDPLYAYALLLEAGEQKAVFVTLDLISVTRQVTDQARSLIGKASGVPPEFIMVSATHAHTGPELAHVGRRGITAGARSRLALEYTEQLPGRITEAVKRALAELRPVKLGTGTSGCEGLAFNRRYYLRDGTVGWNPGKLNPNIVSPAGTTDTSVHVLYVEPGTGGNPQAALATYVNFAMHPDTTGGTKFSADWPGALARILGGYHGTNHITLVANGACGNINHLDFGWDWPNSGPQEQHRIATILGSSVFQAYKDLESVKPGALNATSSNVALDLPPVSEHEVAEARKALEETPNDHGANFMKLVKAHRALDVADRKGSPLSPEVQVITLADQVAWVALPGEIFVELGLAIKQSSPFPHTFIVELANENIGYVPDRRSYAEGNYEPESARCAAGSGERLVEAAVKLLAEAHGKSGAQTAAR